LIDFEVTSHKHRIPSSFLDKNQGVLLPFWKISSRLDSSNLFPEFYQKIVLFFKKIKKLKMGSYLRQLENVFY